MRQYTCTSCFEVLKRRLGTPYELVNPSGTQVRHATTASDLPAPKGPEYRNMGYLGFLD